MGALDLNLSLNGSVLLRRLVILGALKDLFLLPPLREGEDPSAAHPSPLSPPEQGAEAGSQNEG